MTKRVLLFTPGPLTTSQGVKDSMLADAGSRDPEFLRVVREIRAKLLELAGSNGEYEAVPMQGSGTFGIEAAIGSAVPEAGKLLVLINGAYGRRMADIAQLLKIDTVRVSVPENQPVTGDHAREALAAHPATTHLATVHCETTTGILNRIAEVGEAAGRAGCRYIVDAMSSFGGIPLRAPAVGIDFLVSSANKCVQGVPGFCFVIARREALTQCAGRARSVSLDLHAQWRGLEKDGQFRFTPPTHALLAFRQALAELEAEGGIAGRAARYTENHRVLMAGMTRLGFEPYLPAELQSPIITSFRYPAEAAFDFERFYTALSARGFVIYPGKLSTADCFRIGTIGDVHPGDLENLVQAIGEVTAGMGLKTIGRAVAK